MQRFTLVAAGGALLAAGIFLFAPKDVSPQGEAKSNSAGAEGDHSVHSPAAEDPSRAGKHRAAIATEESDHFRVQARQVAAMPQDTGREDAIRSLAQEWAKDAPGAAEEWARGLEDPAECERALTHVCLEVAAQDPREAIRIAQANELQGGTVEAIAGRWAGGDFESAASWARALPEGGMRDRVLMRLVQSHAGVAPAEAASMLSEWNLSDKAKEETAMAVLHQWLLKDPEAARSWVELFPEGILKDRAAAAVLGMSSR